MNIKIFCFLVALACLCVSEGTALAQNKRKPLPPKPPAVEANENAWKTFASAEGRFTVLMPGEPEKNGQVINTGVGSLPSMSVALHTATAEYSVSYMDFPTAFDDPAILKSAYDSGRDESLSSDGLKLVNDHDIVVGSYIGRHITAEGKGKLVNHRIVAVDKRLYQVVIVTRDYRRNSPESVKFFDSTISKFLDSFKLLAGGDDKNTPNIQKTAEAQTFDLGRIENSVYINDYLGFKVSLPVTWHVVERETGEAAMQVSKEMAKGSDKRVNSVIDQSVAKTFVLFIVTKFPLRTPNVTQAMLNCGVERLNDKRVTGSIYLEKNRDFLLSYPARYKLLRDIYPKTIAGLTFFVMDMEQTAGGVTVKQKYYSTIRKGQALFFVTNYFNDADGSELEKILESAKFD